MFSTPLRLMKKFLCNIDLFASAQLLRFKNQTNYSTLTGGFVSLIIIIIFGTILMQDSISVLAMSSIASHDSTYFVEDPTYTSFRFDSSSDLMIGVGINGVDLTKPQRYFDIKIISQVIRFGNSVSKIQYNLQPCKEQQWRHVASAGTSHFQNYGLNQFLCPSANVTVQLQGKYTSQSFRLMEIKISKCKNQTDPLRPCVSQAIFNQSSIFSANFFIMNAYLNSGDIEPVGYYLEDRNYLGFTLDSTTFSNIYITQNIVSTDNSLFPWGSVQNKTVLLVKQLAQSKYSFQVPDQYISVYLRKSPYYIVSIRSFTKLQDLFSSVGGLFGFALFFFFFMQYYTEASFQIQMGDKLFYYNSNKPLKSGGFNFYFFIVYFFYQLLRQTFCYELPWQRMKQYYQCRQQIKQQLDISLLMNKITFLEKCMNIVFEEHQFRAIYLQQKPNVSEAQIIRKNHGLNKIIHKNSTKINKKIQEKIVFYKQKMIKKLNKQENQKNKEQMKITLNKEKDINEVNSLQMQQINGINQLDLKQIVYNFILQDFLKNQAEQIPKNKIQSSSQRQIQSTDNQLQSKSQHIELEEIAGENHQSFQFINTALEDIKKIQEQSKQGNVFSQRIYNQLNNDITKEKIIVLKCISLIFQSKQTKPNQQINKNQKNTIISKKENLFDNLIRLSMKPEEQNKQQGLQIILQSNNRIIFREDL